MSNYGKLNEVLKRLKGYMVSPIPTPPPFSPGPTYILRTTRRPCQTGVCSAAFSHPAIADAREAALPPHRNQSPPSCSGRLATSAESLTAAISRIARPCVRHAGCATTSYVDVSTVHPSMSRMASSTSYVRFFLLPHQTVQPARDELPPHARHLVPFLH